MATGEKTWSTKGQKAVRYTSTPIPPGEYELKLLGGGAAIKKKQEPGKLSYISCAFEVLNTATNEGGRNRQVYHNFFLKVAPQKDGVIPVSRADALNGLAKALGEDLTARVTTQSDEEGNAVQILKPEDVRKWLAERDGMIVQARLKIERQKQGSSFEDRSKIDYFVEAQGTQESEGEAAQEYEMDSAEGAETDMEPLEEATEEVAEEIEEVEQPPVRLAPKTTNGVHKVASPAPHMLKKAAPKPVQKRR